MNPITHSLTGWAIACIPESRYRDRLLITLAAVVPDLDGAGIIVELVTRGSENPVYWWSTYHHVLCHNLAFGLVFTAIAAGFALERRRTAFLVLLSFHGHLLGDLVGARGPDGYQWPIPYLYPFREMPQLVWSGQWQLNAWPNVVLSVALLLLTFRIAWSRGYSPVGLISQRAEAAFVATLRTRFGDPSGRQSSKSE